MRQEALFAAALEGTPERLSRGHDISAKLEASDAVEAVVIPMVVKEKVSGAVYADAVPGEEARFDPDGIAFLTYTLDSERLSRAAANSPLDMIEIR